MNKLKGRKKIRISIIFFLLCVFLVSRLFAQNEKVKFSHLSVNEGLSQSSAFAIVQDYYGFIWIGTYDGLNRYNGYEMEVFRSSNDTLSLPDNYIQALCIDSEGKLWVGTNSRGICKYDYTSNSFYPLSKGNEPLSIGKSVLTLKNYNDTAIVALTEKGIHIINIQTNRTSFFTKEEYIQLSAAPLLISYFNPLKIGDETLNCELLDSKGELWQGTDYGLKRKTKGTWTRYRNVLYAQDSLSSNEITCILEDRGGVLWVGTSLGGISKWDRVAEGIVLYKKNQIASNGLSDGKIRCFYEDSKKQIWIGTVENGINLWDRENNSFKHWNTNNCPSLNNNHIRDLIEWQGNYLVATDGGGVHLFSPENTNKPFKNFKVGDLPSDARIWDLFVDDTSLWVASYSHGLFNIRNDRVTNFSDELPAIKATWVTTDKEGAVWIGTFGEGVFKYDSTGFKSWSTHNSDLSDNRVYTVVPDDQNNIWVATKAGLNEISLSTGQVTVFSEQDGLPNNTIMGIICDKDSSLWLTTNFGVSHFYPKTEDITNYTIRDGLQSNEFLVHSFLQLKSGEMLFGGIQGFNVFPSKLPEPNMYLPPVVITDFATEEGDWNRDSTIFTKSSLKLSSYQNEFSFEFAALNYVEPEKNIYSYILDGFDKEWKKCGNRRFVQYTNVPHGKYVFKVKAANNDKIWNEVPTELRLVIPPAFWQTMLFKVFIVLFIVFLVASGIRLRINKIQRTNRALEDKVKERTREIETTLEKLKITQNQLIHSEKMASVGVLTAGIAHEINNPINFISAGVSSITKDFEDINYVINEIITLEDKGSDAIEKIKRIKNDAEFDIAVNAIKNTVADIKLGAERITEIVSGLTKYSRMETENWLQSNIHEEVDNVLLLVKNKLKYNISIEKKYDKRPCIIECNPGKINQVFMNIIANAIDAIGTGQGTIKITTICRSANILIKIQDTGVGIKKDIQDKIFDPFFTTKPVGKGLGLGLSITYSIIQEHGGKIKVKSAKGQGTEFIIELPVQQKLKVT